MDTVNIDRTAFVQNELLEYEKITEILEMKFKEWRAAHAEVELPFD